MEVPLLMMHVHCSDHNLKPFVIQAHEWYFNKQSEN